MAHASRETEESKGASRNGCETVQLAGIYLKIPQVVIVPAMVYIWRFFSLNSPDDYPVYNMAHAALLVSTKTHEFDITASRISSVLHYMEEKKLVQGSGIFEVPPKGDYEMELLASLNFDTTMVLPHSLALSYIHLLQLDDEDAKFATCTWGYLNDAIRCSGVSLKFPSNVIAVCCIMLASLKLNVTISDKEWWLLFDVEEKELDSSKEMIAGALHL